MKKPPRALALYSLTVLIAGLLLLWGARQWTDAKVVKKYHERQATQQNIPVAMYVAVYGPQAMYLNSALCLLLLAVGPWATRTLEAPSPETPPAPAGQRKFTLSLLALIIVASAIWQAPRLHHSLWADEATSMWKFTVGEYNRNADGQMEAKPVSAEYRQFCLKTPNNHMLYSTLAGLVHQAFFHPSTDPQAPYFSEPLLRIPALLAGLAALAAVLWLAQEMGCREIGLVAVALLALHPWHVQYAGEARGYSLILALVPASLAAALVALRSGRWRWWLAYAFLQVMMVDTWPLAVDVVLLTNVLVVAMLATRYWGTRDLWTHGGRWAAASVIGGMVALQLLWPALPQLQQFMQEQATDTPFQWSFLQEATCALFTGSRWDNIDPENPWLISWSLQVAQHPWLAGGSLMLWAALLVAGVVRLARQAGPARWLAGLFVVLPLLLIVHLCLRRSVFLPWYWIPALPGAVLLIAAGTQWLVERWQWSALGIIALYAATMLPQHFHLRAAPLQQNREAALLTRYVINPTHPDYGKDAMTAYVGKFFRGYDCEITEIKTAPDLTAAMAQAASAGLPFSVNASRLNLLGTEGPALRAILDDPAQFTKLPTLYGTEWESTRWVYAARR